MRRPPIFLALAGAAGFALVGDRESTLGVARLAVCGAALGAVAAIDLAEHRVPNRIVLPAAGCCAILTTLGGPGAGLLAGLVLVAILLLVSLAVPAALGMGDVKLALLVVVGLDGRALQALALGLLLAALAGITVIARHRRHAARRSLPLAPFLAAGALLVLL